MPAREHDKQEREHDTEVLRRMTPAQKLEVMTSLIRQAYALKTAGIRATHPDLPEREVMARAKAMVGDDRP